MTKKKGKVTYPKKTILAVLAMMVASGGMYEGYTLYKGKTLFPTTTVKMSRVIDGDTFEIENGERVRLADVDSSELGECYYQEASDMLEKLLTGKELRLFKDIEERDNFGRLIRYVEVVEEKDKENIFVNEYMVENGFAEYMNSKNIAYKSEIVKAESRAQAKEIGLWKACKQDEVVRTTARRQEQNSLPTDPKCIIKGNISNIGLGKVYILPHCANYEATKIDIAKGEKYFCD